MSARASRLAVRGVDSASEIRCARFNGIVEHPDFLQSAKRVRGRPKRGGDLSEHHGANQQCAVLTGLPKDLLPYLESGLLLE